MPIYQESDHVKQTLFRLWLFAILNVLFRDIHELTTASAINEILTGHVNGAPVTEGVLLIGAFAVEILLLSMLLSATLKPSAVRRLNLTAVPVAAAGMFVVPPADPDDYFFAGVVLTTLLIIFSVAWVWRPAEDTSGGRHAN